MEEQLAHEWIFDLSKINWCMWLSLDCDCINFVIISYFYYLMCPNYKYELFGALGN